MFKCLLLRNYKYETKLPRNVHWKVLYKVYMCFVFSETTWTVETKLQSFFVPIFKMATTAGLSLTLDPMGKMFQNPSLKWTIETKLPRNSHWKVLYKVYVFFMPISRWPPPQHRLTLDYSNAKTVHECSLDGPLQTLRFLFRYEIQNGGYGRT